MDSQEDEQARDANAEALEQLFKQLDALRAEIGPLSGPSSLDLLRADRARDDDA